jgi:hypothetical protein
MRSPINSADAHEQRAADARNRLHGQRRIGVTDRAIQEQVERK